jgi:hypothetical protein
MLPERVREERRARFMAVAEAVSIRQTANGWRDDAGAGGFCAGPGQKRAGWGAAMPMRPRLTGWCIAAAREDQQDAQGRGIHQGTHRGHARDMIWWPCHCEWSTRMRLCRIACKTGKKVPLDHSGIQKQKSR